MIFQEPMTSLNPVLSIGLQLTEALVFHLGMSTRKARERAVEMLRLVHIPEPERRLKQYPHQTLRRHAPAGDDRHGALLPAAPLDRRRAHRRST